MGETRTSRFWAVSAISLALVVWASVAFAAITELQAEDKAARLADALGWSYGPPSGARLEPEPSSWPHPPRYRVDFSKAAEICVYAETGEIQGGVDDTVAALLSGPHPPEGKLGEREAREAAERVLDVWGRPADIRLEKAFQRPDSKYWVFIWKRTFQDIPYVYDAMEIAVSPVAGKLVYFGRSFLSAPPPTAEAKVSEQEAIAAARDAAAKKGMADSAAASASARLMVVQPNDYWEAKPNLESWYPGAPSRVAWVVRFTTGDGYREFWIDAADGRLLGGEASRGTGGLRTPPGAAGQAGPSGATGGVMSSARARILLGSGLGLLALLGAFFVLRTRRAR